MTHRLSVACQWIMLFLGTFLLAAGIAISVWANIGVGPWNTLSLGIMNFTDLSFGRINQLMSFFLVIAGTLMTRRYIGIGTIICSIMVGFWIDVLLNVFPPIPSHWLISVLGVILGTVVLGTGTGLYLSATLGAGPRDTIMLGLSERFKLKIGLSRTVIEVFVLIMGWLMGGPIGLGTVIQAFGIGPVVQQSLSFFHLSKLRFLKIQPGITEVTPPE